MKTKKTKSIVFCPCGQVNTNGKWIVPVIDLAGFIRELEARNLATFTFIKMTCPDCLRSTRNGRCLLQPAMDD
jgi:hypothetical protein